MYSKVVIIGALVAICNAGLLVEDNHQAVSSQSIVRHDQPTQRLDNHVTGPFIAHAGPFIQHSTPIIHQSAPFVHHTAPLVHTVHSAPVVQHVAPVVQHVTPVVHAAPVHVAQAEQEDHAPAHYEFSYSVEDPHTGDHKSQHESRDGDVVKGEYSLLQPDGTIRKVEYTADQHSGFNAIVHNSAPSQHAPTPVHASPVPVHAAPVLHAAVPVLQHH